MTPAPVDSSQQLLDPPHIIMQYAQGEATEHPLYVTVVSIAEEMSMPNSEAIQFGNTVFINHYSSKEDHTDDDEGGAYTRVLNVDTPANLVDNIENYVVYAYRRGIKQVVTLYEADDLTKAIRDVARRVRKNNPHVDFKVTFENYEGQTAAVLSLGVKGS